MFKNFFLPLLLTLLSGFLSIYLWYEEMPLSFFGIIAFFILAVSSFYISVFIAYKIFPDKRNEPVPAIGDLPGMLWRENTGPQRYSKGGWLSVALAISMIFGGVLMWIKVAERYKKYHIEHFGKETRAIIIARGHSKGIGTYRTYRFTTPDGFSYTNKFANDFFSIGDTIRIIYSTSRPVINEVISEGY